jgi:hypothetical protein
MRRCAEEAFYRFGGTRIRKRDVSVTKEQNKGLLLILILWREIVARYLGGE